MQGNKWINFLTHNREAKTRVKAVIFDGDDTLWETQPLFNKAKAQFSEIVSCRLNIEQSEILAKLDEVDVANISKMGFSPQRFPSSLVQTYVILCLSKGVIPTDSEKQQIHSIGTAIFEETPLLLEGAEEILLSLSQSFRIMLYTLGDFKVQQRTIEKLNLDRFFENAIYIVSQKNSSQLQKIMSLNNLAPDDVWVVGNSLKSDINPALQLGIKCIWVNIHSWAYDNGHKLSGIVYEVSSLMELLDIIAQST